MSQKTLRQKIGLGFGLFSLIFIIASTFLYYDEAFYRFMISIGLAVSGLTLRTTFYEDNKNCITYIYYFIILVIATCLIYLGFYNTIIALESSHFLLLSIFLFMFMGLAVATILKGFSL